MNGIVSPVERLKTDPEASARAQAWQVRFEALRRQGWPALRDQMLAAEQRREDGRDTVLLDPTK